jgi:hypothetical protein
LPLPLLLPAAAAASPSSSAAAASSASTAGSNTGALVTWAHGSAEGAEQGRAGVSGGVHFAALSHTP